MFISKKNNNFSIKKLPIIKSIRGDIMNKECFDCGCLNPEYISINNAIFLCEKCSYLHRTFPIEISKIIYNDLYKLEEYELYYLYFGGNRKLSEFIYLNPKLSRYNSDMLYKTSELKKYRYNLTNIVNKKLGLNPNRENYKYKKDDLNNNLNKFISNKTYAKRNMLFLNESDYFDNINNSPKFQRLSTTNKVPQKYKKRYISELDDKYQNNRKSVHNRNDANLFNLDFNNHITNYSNSKSNLYLLNNSNYEDNKSNKSYRHLDRTNFNYKNYINNTININNSNNNNFYFNQSETDIDKKYNIINNMKNSNYNNYMSFYSKFKFEDSKKAKISSDINNTYNISTSEIYFKPKMPKYGLNSQKNKKNIKYVNFSNLNDYYTIQNMYDNKKKIKNKILSLTKKKKFDKNALFNIMDKYPINKETINQSKKESELNYFSDNINILNERNKQKDKIYNSKNKNSFFSNSNIDDSEKIQNLSFIDKNSFEQEIEQPKKYAKKYKERRKLENEERIKMEIEEKRRIEELKKLNEERKEKKKQNKKRMSKKERLKLIEEERILMQQEEIKAKKKKAFENKIIKEEDEEYEQENDSLKDKNKDNLESKNIKENNNKINNNKINNDNNININNIFKDNDKTKGEIVDTFKNSIRNRYKRKKNKL